MIAKRGNSSVGNWRSPRQRGVTMLELSLVLVIAGIILSVAVGVWITVMQARELAQTASALQQTRLCLLQRITHGERYPDSTDGLTCDGLVPAVAGMDVDECLCEESLLDAWGRAIYYLEGVRAPGAGLGGEPLVTNPGKGLTRVRPHPDSKIIDHDGNEIDDVAFVLVSLGKDGEAGETGQPFHYAFAAGGSRVELIDTANSPDFQYKGDDIYLAVTSRELLTYLKR